MYVLSYCQQYLHKRFQGSFVVHRSIWLQEPEYAALTPYLTQCGKHRHKSEATGLKYREAPPDLHTLDSILLLQSPSPSSDGRPPEPSSFVARTLPKNLGPCTLPSFTFPTTHETRRFYIIPTHKPPTTSINLLLFDLP